MRLWRGLGTRIVLASIVCGLLGLSVSLLLVRRTTREAMQSSIAPSIRRAIDGFELARCQQAPETWTLPLERGGRIDAYDGDERKSRNPASPPLDTGLLDRLREGEAAPVQVYRFGPEHGVAMLIRGAPSGPCSVIQASWSPHPARRRRFFYVVIAGGVLVTMLAAGLAVVAVIGPLTRRIERLRRAAGHVGADAGYVPARDLAKDELGELSTILDDAHARIRADASRLEERQRALERYLGDVAHDLKTPIASLQIALEEAASGARDPAQAALLKSSLKDVVYLDALTTNLRLACQLRDGWDPAGGDPRVDLTDVVERVVSRVRYFARNRGMAVEVARPDKPVFARCHATAAEQAVTNLVENAVAHGETGGHVAVILEAREGRFSLAVADDGPGVLPAELPRLAERTFRSDEARQREPQGSGLGLAITREICERCGFTLSFERQNPRGLLVTVAGPEWGNAGAAANTAAS